MNAEAEEEKRRTTLTKNAGKTRLMVGGRGSHPNLLAYMMSTVQPPTCPSRGPMSSVIESSGSDKNLCPGPGPSPLFFFLIVIRTRLKRLRFGNLMGTDDQTQFKFDDNRHRCCDLFLMFMLPWRWRSTRSSLPLDTTWTTSGRW